MNNKSKQLTNIPLKKGEKAPDFKLKVTPDQYVSLSDFKNNIVVLVFYPADFSPVCGSEMALFNQIYPEIKKYDSVLLGISVDNIWTHLAFAKQINLHFPLLSDFNPKGKASREYHAYREDEGVSERAIYVIDKKGLIYWGYISPIGINPGAEGVLDALEKLQKSS